jgi:hypothetical protein
LIIFEIYTTMDFLLRQRRESPISKKRAEFDDGMVERSMVVERGGEGAATSWVMVIADGLGFWGCQG